jgi:hypothetical protein
MHVSNTILFTSAAFAAGTYAALPNVEYVQAIVRDVTTVSHPRSLQRRDDCSDAQEDLVNLINDDPLPLPDAKYISDLASYAQDNDIPTPVGCEEPTYTGELAKDASSYSSEFMSWWDSHTTDLQSVYSACSDDSAFASSLSEIATGCSSLLTDVTGTPKSGGDDSSDDSDSSDNKGSDDDDKDDAAPKTGAAAVAAMAVAGLVAAIL